MAFLVIHGSAVYLSTIAKLIEYAQNAKQREKEAKEQAKKHAETMKLMELREKQEREHTKRMQQLNSKIPQRQFEQILFAENNTTKTMGTT